MISAHMSTLTNKPIKIHQLITLPNGPLAQKHTEGNTKKFLVQQIADFKASGFEQC